MRVESKLFMILAAFYIVVGLLYGFWSEWKEPVGVVALLLTAGLSLMIGGFLGWTGHKLDPRPDDNLEGEISEIEGDFGFFAPYSWWPLFLAGAAALLFLGVAIGWWLVILAVPLVGLATVGWTFEFFRGENAI